MQIHIARGGQELGLFSPDEVRNGIASGQFQLTDYGWAEGQSAWTPLSAFPGLTPATPEASHPATPPGIPSQPRKLVAAAAGPAAGAQHVGPNPISGVAIASMVCGIVGLTIVPFIGSIPAIVCGHVAQIQIKGAAGRLRGRGMALAGLITGYLGVLMLPMLAVLAGIALPVYGSVKARGLEMKALSNAKQIAVACRQYATDHNGSFPKTLEELAPDYLEDRHIFVCPFSKDAEPMGYEYYGGKETDPPENVLLVSKALSQGKRRVVMHVDTSGQVVKDMPSLPPHPR